MRLKPFIMDINQHSDLSCGSCPSFPGDLTGGVKVKGNKNVTASVISPDNILTSNR